MAAVTSVSADIATPRLRLLVLQPTPFCNIDCSYCYLSMAFWLAHDAILDRRWDSDCILLALNSGTAAGAMYGLAAFIALKQRGAQIEQRVWREASPKCLFRIAIRAGLVTWLAIVVSTLIWEFGDALRSIAAFVQMDTTAVLPQKPNQPNKIIAAWSFLPVKITTASFWFLAGAAASAVLASRMTGDVRRTHRSDRMRDAAWLGIGLGLAVALAQLMQSALAEKLGGDTVFSFSHRHHRVRRACVRGRHRDHGALRL